MKDNLDIRIICPPEGVAQHPRDDALLHQPEAAHRGDGAHRLAADGAPVLRRRVGRGLARHEHPRRLDVGRRRPGRRGGQRPLLPAAAERQLLLERGRAQPRAHELALQQRRLRAVHQRAWTAGPGHFLAQPTSLCAATDCSKFYYFEHS